MPHSTYLGILSEFGIFGFISIILILLYTLKSSLNANLYLNTNMSIIIIYLILEGLHMDIIMLKLVLTLIIVGSIIPSAPRDIQDSNASLSQSTENAIS